VDVPPKLLVFADEVIELEGIALPFWSWRAESLESLAAAATMYLTNVGRFCWGGVALAPSHDRGDSVNPFLAGTLDIIHNALLV
jgi:hypothetical protein